MRLIPINIFLLVFLLVYLPYSFAEPHTKNGVQQFPDWMDKVEFSPRGQRQIQIPQEPIDPDSAGAIRSPGRPGSSRFHFSRPKLPDFSVLRKKAQKYSKQNGKVASYNEEAQSFSGNTIAKDQQLIGKLKQIIQTLGQGEPKLKLEKKIAQLQQRICVAQELQKLLASKPGQVASDTKTVALSQKKKKRVQQLKKLLFVEPVEPACSLVAPTRPRKTSRGPAKIPGRFYRPKFRRSFFKESKDQQLAPSP